MIKEIKITGIQIKTNQALYTEFNLGDYVYNDESDYIQIINEILEKEKKDIKIDFNSNENNAILVIDRLTPYKIIFHNLDVDTLNKILERDFGTSIGEEKFKLLNTNIILDDNNNFLYVDRKHFIKIINN